MIKFISLSLLIFNFFLCSEAQKNGRYVVKNHDGTLYSVSNYNYGALNGNQTIYTHWGETQFKNYNNDTLLSILTIAENGDTISNLVYMYEYANQRQTGLRVYTIRNGQRILKNHIIYTYMHKDSIRYNSDELHIMEMVFHIDSPKCKSLTREVEFKGGESALSEFLSENLVYPEKARESEITGDILLEFTIETDGTISNIKIIGPTINAELENEPIRVLKLTSGKWLPAMSCGVLEKKSARIPISFYLEN